MGGLEQWWDEEADRINAMSAAARERGSVVATGEGSPPLLRDGGGLVDEVVNAFCPTGPGGGVDPTCSPGEGGGQVRSDGYGKAGNEVDGRTVRNEIPNQSSIEASLTDWEVLPGVREVPLSEFTLTGKSYSVSETNRIRKLADAIAESNEISPLIVVDDGDPVGPYILEGGHRAEALYLLGAKSMPAMVVKDLEAMRERGLIDKED